MFNVLFFWTFSYFILYLNHKKITFFNYTDFVVNYDEGQYIPNFIIQLIYNVS